MELSKIIDDIQKSILTLQRRLDELRSLDDGLAETTLLTRQEAADFVGVSLRQFDRDCIRYGVEKLYTIGGIRIRKSELMVLMGLRDPENTSSKYRRHASVAESDFDRIIAGRKS